MTALLAWSPKHKGTKPCETHAKCAILQVVHISEVTRVHTAPVVGRAVFWPKDLMGSDRGFLVRRWECTGSAWRGKVWAFTSLETNQGQIGSFLCQLPFKCYLPEVASVGN